MSRGINKVILVGRLGNDPDVRYTANGMAVTTISLATSDKWIDRSTGEVKTRTEWHRVIFFKRLAEIAGEYLHKGSQVYVEGSLRTNKYTDKNGIERYSTDINATELQMLGSGRNPISNPAGVHVDDLSIANEQSPARATNKNPDTAYWDQGEPSKKNKNNDFDINDAEIPF